MREPRAKPKISKELYEELCELCTSLIDEEGRELPNPKPHFVDVTPAALPLREQVQRLVRVEMSRQMRGQGMETFEESIDFDVKDEFDMEPAKTVYEMVDEVPVMQEDTPEDPAGKVGETGEKVEPAAKPVEPDPGKEKVDV